MRNGNIALGLGVLVVALLAASGKLGALWAAIMKAEQQVAGASSDTAASTPATSSSPTASSAAGGQNVNLTGNRSVVAAIPTGLSATIAQYGSDLYDYCLAFVNKTRTAAGLGGAPYGAATAAQACSQLSLSKGVAPAGATVCFRPTASNPDGHIGIALGGDSYASAGLIHGGIVNSSYLNNPNYAGYSQ